MSDKCASNDGNCVLTLNATRLVVFSSFSFCDYWKLLYVRRTKTLHKIKLQAIDIPQRLVSHNTFFCFAYFEIDKKSFDDFSFFFERTCYAR